MAESSLYRLRLQAIAEKRKVLEHIEKTKQALEDERLKAQQLKRKSLRDRWLMEDIAPASDESDPSSPLWQTQSRIQQLEDTLTSLRLQVSCLETQEPSPCMPTDAALEPDATREDGRTDPPAGRERQDLPQLSKRELQMNGNLELAVPFVADGNPEDDVTGENVQETVTKSSATGKETRNCERSSEPLTNKPAAELMQICLNPRDEAMGAARESDPKNRQVLDGQQTAPNSSQEGSRTAETHQLPLQERHEQAETQTSDKDERKYDCPLQPPPGNMQVQINSLPATLLQENGLDGVTCAEYVLVTEDAGDDHVESLPGIGVTPLPSDTNGDPKAREERPYPKETSPALKASLNNLTLSEATVTQQKLASAPEKNPSVTQGKVIGAQKEKQLVSEPVSLQGQLMEIVNQEENLSIHGQMPADQEQMPSAQQTIPMEWASVPQEQILTHLNQLPAQEPQVLSLPEDTLPSAQQTIPTEWASVPQEQILTHLNQLLAQEPQVLLLPEDILTTVQEQMPSAQQTIPTEWALVPQEQILTHQVPVVTNSEVDHEPALPVAEVATDILGPEQQPLLQAVAGPASQAFPAVLSSNTQPPNKQPSIRWQGAAAYTTPSVHTAQAGHSKVSVTGADGRGPKQKTCHCCSVM